MSAIKAGDLVMVVRSGCAHFEKLIGRPFIVSYVIHAKNCVCADCPKKYLFFGPPRVIAPGPAVGGLPGYHVPTSWLIKVDPPAQDERTTTEEELHA